MSVQEERPYCGSLLDPRTHGWVLKQSWEGLFDLYARGDEKDEKWRAELSPELASIEAALYQSYSVGDTAVKSMKWAFFMSAVLHQAMNEGVDDSFGFQDFRKQVADRIAGQFGKILIDVMGAKTPRAAKLETQTAVNLMRRTMATFVHAKFPGGGRGNRSSMPKAVLAIWHARMLCERYRSLPTKREVRARLRDIGVDYTRSKDLEGQWIRLFVSAGLSTLPE